MSQPYTISLGQNWGWTHPSCSPCAVVGQYRATSLQPCSAQVFTCACQREGSTSGCEGSVALLASKHFRLQTLWGRGRSGLGSGEVMPSPAHPTPQACIPALQSLAHQRQHSTPISGAPSPAPELPNDWEFHLREGPTKPKGDFI